MCNPGQLCFRAHHNTLQANSGYTPYDTDFDANLHAAASSLPIAPHQLFNASNDNSSNPHALPSSTSFHTISPMLCSQSDCPWVESGPHLQHDKVFDLNDNSTSNMHMDVGVNVGFGDLAQQLTSPDVNALSQPSTATNFTDFVNGLQPSIQSLPPTSSSSTSIFQHNNINTSISAKPELLNAVNVNIPEPLQPASATASSYHRKFSTESELDNHSSTTNSYDSLDGGNSLGCNHPLADDQYGSSASVGQVDFQIPADIEQYQGNRCNNQNIDKSLYTPLQQQYRQRQVHTKISSNSSMDDNQQMSPQSSPGITITPKLSTRVSTAGSTAGAAAADGKYQPTRGKKMQYKLKDKARRKCIGDCVETIRSLLHISTLHRTDQASVLLIACDAIQQYQSDDKSQKAELKRSNATIRELEARLAKQELELQQAATRCGLPAGHR